MNIRILCVPIESHAQNVLQIFTHRKKIPFLNICLNTFFFVYTYIIYVYTQFRLVLGDVNETFTSYNQFYFQHCLVYLNNFWTL